MIKLTQNTKCNLKKITIDGIYLKFRGKYDYTTKSRRESSIIPLLALWEYILYRDKFWFLWYSSRPINLPSRILTCDITLSLTKLKTIETSSLVNTLKTSTYKMFFSNNWPLRPLTSKNWWVTWIPSYLLNLFLSMIFFTLRWDVSRFVGQILMVVFPSCWQFNYLFRLKIKVFLTIRKYNFLPKKPQNCKFKT